MERLVFRLIDALVRMGAEIVALRLNQVGGQAFGTVGVEIGERGRKAGRGNTEFDGRLNDVSPRRLRAFDGVFKVRREKEILQIRIGVERFLNAFEEDRADNTSAAPQERDLAAVERPAVLFRGRLHLHESLRVTADLRRVERLLDLPNEFVAIPLEFRVFRAAELFARVDAERLHSGDGARVDRLGYERARNAEIERELAHPLAGPLRARRVENLIDERLARLRIVDRKDIARNLN